MHTKGLWARRPFILEDWQRDEIVQPVFGTVEWSEEWGCYRRRYTDARIEIARKNGKSELAAAVALYLTCADDEESAEVYGCAVDVPQARKVFDVALRMVQLSSKLARRLTLKESARRIIDERTGSYYEVVPADAKGNLGHNPHGVILDEELTQPSGDLWEALTSAEGTRVQPLFWRATTATNDPSSWSAKEHEEAKKIAEDPERVRHRFVWMRNTSPDVDPFDEKNWGHANPALDHFLTRESMRRRANEAKNDPTKENAFKQLRLNMHVQQVTRYVPLHLWDACNSEHFTEEQLEGKRCWGGLDLSATTDFSALSWIFKRDDNKYPVLWRFFMPEAQVELLNKRTGGRITPWVKQGFIRVTEGDVIDYDVIHDVIVQDAKRFGVQLLTLDPWNSTATSNFLEKKGIPREILRQGKPLSPYMKEMLRLVKQRALLTNGNPVARYNADSLEAKQDSSENVQPVKPERDKSGKRIDGMISLLMSISGLMKSDEARKQGFALVI